MGLLSISFPMKTLSNYNIRDEVRKYVHPSSTLMTDKARSYAMLDKEYPNREIVNHGDHEYVNGDAHVNNPEGWFALLRRGVMGTFHHIREQHLDRYVDEFAFRYNRREITDAEKTVTALKKIGGKRLKYK